MRKQMIEWVKVVKWMRLRRKAEEKMIQRQKTA